jgi:mannose/fructose/N-acetylgalactosamine-specific phosphotransferase system component IIB
MKKIKFLFLILLYQLTFGQTASEKLIHGKIMVESGQVAGVTIINLVNEKSTSSDTNGEFYILAKADDLLVFSSVNLEYHRKQIEEEDIKKEVIIIKMTSKVTELKEVIVNKYPQINAVALGISPKGIKKYTPAERRLFTANSTPVDALLNLMSGRTAMLKKELEVEKKERSLMVFRSLFDDSYFKETLKIPVDYIKGFQYYCIENPEFREVSNSKNKTKIEFLIVPLATKFNEIISDEN